MADMFDYLDWRGDLSFEAVPFGKIDALILSQLSYLKFNGLVPQSFKLSDAMTLCDLNKIFKAAPDYDFRVDLGPGINERSAELLDKAASCERFKNVRILGFCEKIDEQNVEQFAAMVFVFDKTSVITFRGTDETIVGWKEDCNIACVPEIPSQRDASVYCQMAFNSLKTDFIICGHSKGGNLAISSAVKCGAKSQKKISAIYNFDGPGFSKAFFESPEFRAIENRLVNVYPSGSIVGMIFCHPQNFEIIKATRVGAMQHDPCCWQILGNNFVHKKDFAKESYFFYNSVNNWIDRMSTEEKQNFVNSIFEVIEAPGFKTVTESYDNPVVASAKIIKKLASMDKTTRDDIKRVMHNLRICVKEEIPFLQIFER